MVRWEHPQATRSPSFRKECLEGSAQDRARIRRQQAHATACALRVRYYIVMTRNDILAAYDEAAAALIEAHAKEMRALEEEAQGFLAQEEERETSGKLASLRARLFGH